MAQQINSLDIALKRIADAGTMDTSPAMKALKLEQAVGWIKTVRDSLLLFSLADVEVEIKSAP